MNVKVLLPSCSYNYDYYYYYHYYDYCKGKQDLILDDTAQQFMEQQRQCDIDIGVQQLIKTARRKKFIIRRRRIGIIIEVEGGMTKLIFYAITNNCWIIIAEGGGVLKRFPITIVSLLNEMQKRSLDIIVILILCRP